MCVRIFSGARKTYHIALINIAKWGDSCFAIPLNPYPAIYTNQTLSGNKNRLSVVSLAICVTPKMAERA